MSEQLRPEGIPVFVDNVVITTPGLTGRVTVHQAGSEGMRGAEDSTAEFRAALADHDLAEQLTVEISEHAELDGEGGTRAGGGGSEIVVEVPGPGDGNGQLLLYVAEDGSVSWHLPDDVAPEDVPHRGGDRRSYRIPRAVAQPAPGEVQEGGQRGLLGAVGKKLLKVLVFPLIDPVLGAIGDHFASRWENKNRRNLVRSFTPANYTSRDLTDADAINWDLIGGGTALLFVHGTFSMSDSGFGAIPADLMTQLHDRYQGRVFAIDHFSISVTPEENLAWIATHLPSATPLTVDVVAHSRGGLVARALAERAATVAGLAQRLTVRNVVMVGTPNAGTALAHKDNLSKFLDRITGILQFVPDNAVTDTLDVVLSVLKQIAIGAFGGLDGIMCMNPAGEYLLNFNKTDGSTATYHAVASNYDPPSGSSVAQIARNGVIDVVFGAAHNDLVVPTNGVFEVPGTTGFPIADPLVFEASEGVIHSTYWTQPKFAAKLLEWLPG